MAPKTAEKKPVKAAQKEGGKKGGKKSGSKKGVESWKVRSLRRFNWPPPPCLESVLLLPRRVQCCIVGKWQPTEVHRSGLLS